MKSNVQCKICFKNFGSIRSLKIHAAKHAERVSRKFMCHLCSQNFLWKTHLLNHLDDIHKVPKEYQCGICEKYFHHLSRFMNHFKSVHPNDEVKVLQNIAYRKQSYLIWIETYQTRVRSGPWFSVIWSRSAAISSNVCHKITSRCLWWLIIYYCWKGWLMRQPGK